jgi:hypothetical protein
MFACRVHISHLVFHAASPRSRLCASLVMRTVTDDYLDSPESPAGDSGGNRGDSGGKELHRLCHELSTLHAALCISLFVK